MHTTKHQQYMAVVVNGATVKQAHTWADTAEPFAYCLDLLGLSLALDGDEWCAAWVERLEARFDLLVSQPA